MSTLAGLRRLGLSTAVVLTAVTPQLVLAHAGGNEDVMTTLDALPAAMGKIRIELHKTLGSQLVVENTTSTPLEIIGTDGKPFLRISQTGVDANINAPDWYRFYSTGGAPQPERLTRLPKGRTLPADWKQVSRTSAWGWFDGRLDGESLKVPHRVRDSTAPTSFKTWQIPVLLGGKPQTLTGQFKFIPQPRGFYEARITSSAEIADGVTLQVMQGPVPGFMLENSSVNPVMVLDSEGQPFLELTPAGVRANVRSIGWRNSGLAESSYTPMAVEAGEGPLWQSRSETPRFTWLDNRAAVVPKKSSGPAASQRWEIPLVYQGQRLSVQGVTQWVAYGAAAPVAVKAHIAQHASR